MVGQKASFGRAGEARRPTGQRGIAPALFYAMFTLLLAGNAGLGTALLFAPDIARLLNGRNEQVIAAYEDRIAQLRVEVDRLHSRSYAQAGDINLQLQELAQQQEVLIEQHQLVRALVDKADQLGIEVANFPAPEENIQQVSLAGDGNPDLGATATAVARMMDETQYAMSSIADTATSRTASIVSALSGLGIRLDLPEALDGMGGPLIAPIGEGGEASAMVEDANAVMAALLRYKAARAGSEMAPIHMPLSGNFRQSSGFGNRTDPFTGGRAFHSGMDFAAPTGTIVLSAGTGVVSFVGTRAGYGKVVEVRHDNGLVSRYAHLSDYLSRVGQQVNNGTPIALVGSTGRSTGPHLHFEVRRGDDAINPKAFLEAGKKLRAILG